jgi:hypothetical protein
MISTVPPCVWHFALQMLFYLISMTYRHYYNLTLAHQESSFHSSQGKEAWKTEAFTAGGLTGQQKTIRSKMQNPR